jgi:hypothetical protein
VDSKFVLERAGQAGIEFRRAIHMESTLYSNKSITTESAPLGSTRKLYHCNCHPACWYQQFTARVANTYYNICTQLKAMNETLEHDSVLSQLQGLSEEELATNPAAWKLLSLQPCEVPLKPSVDTIVVWFLHEHGIHVLPPVKPNKPRLPVKHRIGRAVMGGAMGALGGPLAVGVQSHLSQQEETAIKSEKLSIYAARMAEYAAAQQEWTTWKQWSLSHEEWSNYYDECLVEWEHECEQAILSYDRFEEWIRSEEGLSERRELFNKVQSYKALIDIQQKKKARKELAVSVLCILTALISLVVISNQGFSPLIAFILVSMFLLVATRAVK